MIYKMTLKDSTDEMTFNLLEVPIVDKDIEGAVDNVTLDGNQYTDYLYLKKQYIQKWSIMCDEEYERLRGFYTRQFDEAEIPTYELYYGETIYNDYTLSGEYILADVQGVEPARMSLAQIDGNATQTTYSGKNKVYLPSGTYTSSGITWTVTDETIKANGTASSNWSMPMSFTTFPQPLPAGTYTFSIPSAINKNFQLNLRDENEVSHDYNIIAQSTSVTFTISFVATSFRFALRAETGTTTNFTIPNQLQLEAGSSKTSYEQYVGGIPAPNPSYPQPISTVTGAQTIKVEGSDDSQEYPINLGNIWLAKIGTYQDGIYEDDGKWYVEKQVGKVVLDGSETWVGGGTFGNYWRSSIPIADIKPIASNVDFVGLSDHFYKDTGVFSTATIQEGMFCQFRNDTKVYFACPISVQSASDWTTWLQSHNTTVYYALATPTTTQITDTNLINQLEALVNVSITTGIHNIFTEVASGNLNPVMIFNFIEVVSRRVTLVPETPVRLTLTDGGIINACGCRKDVQLTMRETIE